ncbi:MAG: FtsX-like permease family protein [Clostridia bacterium]
MKKSLLKNNLKEISKTRRRFISIMIMAFLGVGFYSGLRASSPDMLESLDKYTDTNKMYDLQVISTAGLTDNDVESLKEIDGIEKVEGVQTKDVLSKLENKEKVCKIIEYNENVNKPTVIEGRFPETSSECLLDSRYTIIENVNDLIGKKIIIENEDKNSQGQDLVTQKEFTITGIVNSPIYISNERGNTSIGDGSIGYYIYTKDDVLNIDYYTEIDVKVKEAEKYLTNSDKYLDTINPIKDKIEEIKEERENARYEQIIENYRMINPGINIEAINIEKPTWKISDRMDNVGYSNIFDAIKTMSNISKLFPIIFYLVAVLISLTSMTRMIEEERIEIGTLKSLGYTNLQIIMKYVLYSFLACVIGGIVVEYRLLFITKYCMEFIFNNVYNSKFLFKISIKYWINGNNYCIFMYMWRNNLSSISRIKRNASNINET